ncbi:CRISPR-associated helicase/endonuclease Cas3 [Parapedobacter koreensis]|uniref:CRISPR-associated endonuclease/helicase Cas3 n=1 Tax=Parapedobacter koreensis TaxID=332977 RepID=A0A1H7U0G2_9SPHI|nr:CRISPR-associated helicase/endonuclease Cas3 [Parapedobacter koreensis]SEL90156.1 CRISPR-associated endonuclease/helicase Cas3 [Parapedobacter koreensis]
MRTFREIGTQAPNIVDNLANYEKYWAHIHVSKPPESLQEHILLVNEYAARLVEVHGLDKIIDKLLLTYVDGWGDEEDADFLKMLFVHTIVFHDFGKINENFQTARLQNNAFTAFRNTSLKPPHGHSFLGAFIFLSYHIHWLLKNDWKQERKITLICHCFFLAYTIMQHHSPALYDIQQKEGFMSQFRHSVNELRRFIASYSIVIDEPVLTKVFANVEDMWHKAVKNKLPYTPFPLFALIKLNFSLLTAADYLATHEYMNGNESNEAKTTDFGLLNDRNRVNEIIGHLQKHKYNADTFNSLHNYQFVHPTTRSSKNLNLLRKEMSIELVREIRGHLSEHLFYLEAPTGGGKTNLSAIAIAELLRAHEDINKVFYVFPFTTLITQTFGALKESMGLHDDEIIELHSKAAFASKTEALEDGLFGGSKKDFIDNLFALYPITLVSHVKFFEILKTNRKEVNYLLHRLANAVVVIDEIQSYNPAIWDKMLYFISNSARFFNIRFILMSATLPKISELKVGLTQTLPFVELLPNARKYMTNPNFSDRVSFNFELFEQGEISLETLAASVLEKSENYAQQHGAVRTIVEFIYKRSASAFQRLFENNGFFDEVFVLSGTILESRRREIINFIKRTTKQSKNILLITTQVVEAGVDIDMDLGFKNVSLLDSDEQLAGRVNRNASKDGCEVYLFRVDDAHVLYGKDYRYAKTKEYINQQLYQEILKTKDFKQLYEKVLLYIDDSNNPLFKNSISDYENCVDALRYTDVDKGFQIIDQENSLVFVPLKVPILIDGMDSDAVDEIFTPDDLRFLERFGVLPQEDVCHGKQRGFIDGEKVWDIYRQLIEQQVKEHVGFNINRKIDFKVLQSIMAKFSFSLVSYSKDYRKIQEGFGVEEYGFMYFSHWNEEREKGKPYDYVTGLNSEAFSDSFFI